MKKYYKIFILSFETFFEYRWELVSKYFIEMIGVFFMLFVWKVITDQYGSIGGYSFEAFVVYYLLFGVFRNLKASDIWVTFDEWIRLGSISSLLIKPVDARIYAACQELARVVSEMIVTIFVYVPVISIFPLFRNSITLSADIFALIIIFSLFTFIFTTLFYMILGISAFWLKSTGGLGNLVQQIVNILRGGWFPLDIAPRWFQNFVLTIPFSYTLFVPIKILLGGREDIDIIKGFIVMGVSTFVCFIAAKILWKLGIRQFEAVGQ